jgi:DNA repair exonuclease SbcCD ATPase subunit
MRFAINELFSRHLGLLVLDEPSANMDRDNVVALRRLFEQIHDVSLKTGVQTVVITHHSELLGAFDGVISV